MRKSLLKTFVALAMASGISHAQEKRYLTPIDVTPEHISKDKSVDYDYDIVYVRSPRFGDKKRARWTEVFHPALTDPGADLMLLHPDGKEEVLVKAGKNESVTDPFVSFDGQWVYYSKFHDLSNFINGRLPVGGADIYKIHVKSRKIVRLTHQKYTPNTGMADWSKDFRSREKDKNYVPYGALNLGPCPLPGGKIMFTSNRNAFRPPKQYTSPCLQLFVMDDDGKNVEMIGHLNIGSALHPTILRDGRVMFSSFESQGSRDQRLWGVWTIHPDGTNWAPLVSAFKGPNAFHFMTQLSDGTIVVEEYYNLNNSGFGTHWRMPENAPAKYTAFGPGNPRDPRNKSSRVGRHYNGRPKLTSMPFMPYGMETITRFAHGNDGPADRSSLKDKKSPAVGKVTHPSAAPDNHLLTVWSPGPANHQYKYYPLIDGGIFLIKKGEPIDEPGQMLLIKNDPNFNEQWPRALVPYERIFGMKEPRTLAPLLNDGKQSPHLPEGTPFGLVGTSSLYKRESYPAGSVAKGSVTAVLAGMDRSGFRGLEPWNTSENGASLNWFTQGAEAGIYSNDDIHAVRILAMEPTTDRIRGPKSGRLFYNHASERLRILGEIPVRHFGPKGEPLDPDGNPDTSFLAKIPADVAFTFQTLDKDGMVLNMAQTWHQVRPGEIRNNCGGCHAHSQKPTPFKLTMAAKPNYKIFDLTKQTPLMTTKANDQSKRKWDAKNETGLHFENGVKNVEYHRDIKPILQRSCVACHSAKGGNMPAGKLVLDDDEITNAPGYSGARVPGTYYRLALDSRAKYGHKPLIHNGTWRQTNASRYIRKFQSRRSLLVWKIFGRRTDGWKNEDFPSAKVSGDPATLYFKGKKIEPTRANRNRADLDYDGKPMPPPAAVAAGKVKPLTDEDRRTIVRWIDLGCPIDLDYDPKQPGRRGYGWMGDDNRPTLTVTYPKAGKNIALDRIVIGMHDYYSGLDEKSFKVTADFKIDGVKAGENLAGRFNKGPQGVWELQLKTPVTRLREASLTVSVRDRQGNVTRIVRSLKIGAIEIDN